MNNSSKEDDLAQGNTITVSGNTTGDVQVRDFGDNLKARVGIAWNQNVKKDDGSWDTKPHFFNIEAWGGQAKTLAKFAKGDLVTVYGRLDWHSWEDSDGNKREAVIILADAVIGEPMYEKEYAEGTQVTEGKNGGSGGDSNRSSGRSSSRRGGRSREDAEPAADEKPSGRQSGRRTRPEPEPEGDGDGGEDGIPW